MRKRIRKLLAIGLAAVLGVTGITTSATSIMIIEDNNKNHTLQKFTSYNELEEFWRKKGRILEFIEDDIVTESYARSSESLSISNTGDLSMQDVASAVSTQGGESYSSTNLQEEGVDEADILKNDGRYLYIRMSNNKLAIVDTQGSLKCVATIKGEEGLEYSEIFLEGNTLILLGSIAREKEKQTPQDNQVSKALTRRNTSVEYSVVQILDITHKEAPSLKRQVEVQGYMNTVRKIENTLYLFTNAYTNRLYEGTYDTADIVPTYKDDLAGATIKNMPAEHIYYDLGSSSMQYTVMSSIPLKGGEAVELQAVLGDGLELYMSETAAYLYGDNYSDSWIHKFTAGGSRLNYVATGQVDGRILNQFSLGEYKGNLRLATSNNYDNSVFVLDAQMKMIGKIGGIAPEERIYSVRFTGDKGYVVTFKETDPLFALDLSNPTAPEVLGELKIPGFSQYLHPISDNLVVGIGRSTEEVIRRDEEGNEVIVGATVGGIKLSLFDVTKPETPIEINHINLGVSGSYSEALDNHRAVTVLKEENLLAIPVNLRFNDSPDFEGAYVFGLEAGKLVGKAKLGRVTAVTYNRYYDIDRVCFIGNKLYYVYGTTINEYELKNFNRQLSLDLETNTVVK